RSLISESHIRFNLGWRTNLMWDDAQTNDFYYPSRFPSHVAVAQGYGRIASWLEYWGEVAGGWQSEWMTPFSHPLQVAGKLVWNPNRHLAATLEAGRSTSSLDRPSEGLRAYSRKVISAGLQVRFP